MSGSAGAASWSAFEIHVSRITANATRPPATAAKKTRPKKERQAAAMPATRPHDAAMSASA